jgi:hypothetical protein
VQHKARLLDLVDQLCELGAKSCPITGISSGASNRLYVDGVDAGVQTPSSPGVATTWDIALQLVTPRNDATCNFSTDLSGHIQCKKLLANKGATSPAACEAACCASTSFCNVWQFADHQGCWMGDVDISSCSVNTKVNTTWTGGGRAGGPGPTPPAPPAPMKAVKNLTMTTMDAGGRVLASHTLLAPVGSSASLKSDVDVPSTGTGTGTKLVLDGIDTGIVRVTLVDAAGSTITTDANGTNVTFEVVSGPGRILGVASGDPSAHTPQQGVTCRTFAGTAKALVKVTVDCVSPGRSFLATVDGDSGKQTKIVPEGESCTAELVPIVVRATATVSGASVSVTAQISVSDDVANDSVLAVARASATSLDFTLLDTFQG